MGFDVKDLIPYIVAQVVGATAAAFVLYIIAQGQAGFSGVGGFATNGFGDLSPNKFGLGSAFIIEVVLTAFFLIIILGATDRRACWLRSYRDWFRLNTHSLNQYSGYEHFGKPCT